MSHRPVNISVVVNTAAPDQAVALDVALKALKKQWLNSGLYRSIKARMYFEQPSTARRMKHQATVNRQARYTARGRAMEARGR